MIIVTVYSNFNLLFGRGSILNIIENTRWNCVKSILWRDNVLFLSLIRCAISGNFMWNLSDIPNTNGDMAHRKNSDHVIGDGRGSCPVGSNGEFATFGFLSFITTLFSSIVNMGQCVFSPIYILILSHSFDIHNQSSKLGKCPIWSHVI